MRGNAFGLTGVAIGILLLVIGPGALHAEVSVPDPGSFVVDTAGVIDAPAEQQLEGLLRELEQKTSAQIKVLTVLTTEDEEIFSFTQRHYDQWKLGKKDKDDGALIVLALRDQKVRIHTGYGLESILPDSWAGSLSREAATNYFKQGKYSEGLLRLTAVTALKVAEANQVKLTGAPKFPSRARRGGTPGAGLGAGLLPILFLFFLFSSMRRRRRHYSAWGGSGMGGLAGGLLLGSLLGGALGGRRSHWGGGYGAGLGGGFGGGFGGGSFGGGGLSGGGGGGASW